MARIIGGVACSHTPTIGFAHDKAAGDDPVWGPIVAAFAPVKAWLKEQRPDVAIVVYNDHVTSFFFDHYAAFALGVGERFEVADEGGGPRDLPGIQGHPAFAAHIGASLTADEFDLSFFQDRPLDHGCFSPLSVLCDHAGGWPFPIVPLQVGVLQSPGPNARRCWKLGQALRRAIESFPQDLRVAIIATGGLSHQVHGERSGFNNTGWDAKFLDLIVNDPVRLTEMTVAELATLGGYESAEVIMWLVMRGALSANVTPRHQAYYLPSMTGIATLVFENHATPAHESEVRRHREHMARETLGLDALEGTYPFTLERSVKAYRINKFLHSLIDPQAREAFRADEAGAMRTAGLSDVERDLLARRDWQALMHYGVIFFLLEKLAAVSGLSNLHVYAAMRGQSMQEFLQTRNAPTAVYSVSGSDPSARKPPHR
ncbi:gallate dioxygenase [Scleromatobacter humisilvae]|uniref:Gallate dioxygenase n=1 Tax=Scleromatobacter humisilvae TaxID=2897159 RepID=A0A9X1YIA7_9BURK|nr:gallate dioxygenase [Scleromatobacter humisilvae]MCK9685375.1 gallate dioxygenase [Scleromatobacter humisilvae]